MPEQCFPEKMQPSEDMTFTSDLARHIDNEAFLRLLLIYVDSEEYEMNFKSPNVTLP